MQNRLVRLFSTSIGHKLLMALTGLGLLGFLVTHMVGNLLVFKGPDAINTYAATLQGSIILWPARLGLIGLFGLHVYLGFKLVLENQASRPQGYVCKATQRVTLAGRWMIHSGCVVLAFVVYHLLHFTMGVVDHENYGMHDALGRHDVYTMVVQGFQDPLITSSYILAMGLLTLHLWHGAQSLFQTLGLNHKTYNQPIRVACYGGVVALTLGYLAVPMAAMFGVIDTQDRIPGGPLTAPASPTEHTTSSASGGAHSGPGMQAVSEGR